MARGMKHTHDQVVNNQLGLIEVAIANAKTTSGATDHETDELPMAQRVRRHEPQLHDKANMDRRYRWIFLATPSALKRQ